MRKTNLWLRSILAALLILAIAPFVSAQGTGSVHGHVQDPLGVAISGVQVQLSVDGGATAKYTFTTDANGDYKGDGVAPGSYTMTLFNADKKSVDRFNDVKVTAGADTAQDFDLSRADYVSKMTPEQQKELAAARAKNAEVGKENSQIKNLNADLVKAREDTKSGNFAEADQLMTRDSVAKPDEALIWVELGKAQKGEKKYDQAAVSLQKAVDLDAASKKPRPDVQAAALNELGEVQAGLGKVPDSQAAYDKAAQLDPKSAAMYYGNEAIMMDRAGQVDATVAAADKAIAADPSKPLPYYLKGKALINKATVDPKTQKIIAPEGCAEAYQKYLELAPNGQFAADAKAILDQLGTSVQTHYKAGKKS